MFGLVVTLVVLAAASFAAPAGASTGDIIAPQHPPAYTPEDGWQAGTCREEPPESPALCSVASPPSQYFETAAAHPQYGFTQFIVKHQPPGESPVGELETVHVDLPVGLSVNPGATQRCSMPDFEADNCPGPSQVGESEVTASVGGVRFDPLAPLTRVPVYNLVPEQGEPAAFGLKLAGNEVFLRASLAWDGDFHEGFTIAVPKAVPVALSPLVEGAVLANRLVFKGRSGDGTFITTPSTCLGPAVAPHEHDYSTYLLAGSYAEEEQAGYVFPASAEPAFESPIPPGTSPKSCGTIPYAPGLSIAPGTSKADSPAGATTTIAVPHVVDGEAQDSSDTRQAQLVLPRGMGLNPAAAGGGLQTCSDAQFHQHSKAKVECPPESKVGTVEIQSPPLPEGDLGGDVFVGEQKSSDPLSGNEYRIFVDAESARYGVAARLVGNVSADPRTGQLTATFSETPQVPFSSFRIALDGGPRAVLSSPPVCGPNPSRATMTPWSGNAAASPSDAFTLSEGAAGGSCPATMASRPFAPGFAAGPDSARAGAFSPLRLNVSRADGEQELKGADLTLAPGMTASLRGIPYCSEAALAAAAARSGAAERAASSCPAASQIGTATVSAGTGSEPLRIAGKVFLSGPYRGAPLSLAVVTPATAGPFDLGTVVVRVALFVDPETARVRAVSDSIPDVFGGTKLSLRSVAIALDRGHFSLNPTSCGPLASSGALAGGGADPTDPAAFSSFAVSAPFQTSDCQALGFGPKLLTRLEGGKGTTRRSQHPRLHAVLNAREGDANVGRAALTLPHALFLDQGHIKTICTRVQLAAGQCPAGSVYGYARARTPLLDDELAGPVYLVSSNHELPDLLADLQGQVDVHLHGVISAAKGRIRTVFDPVPDVPVSRFALTMKGGKQGLLVNSRNLCQHRSFSFMNFKAQNGKRLVRKRLPLHVPACGHGKSHRR